MVGAHDFGRHEPGELMRSVPPAAARTKADLQSWRARMAAFKLKPSN